MNRLLLNVRLWLIERLGAEPKEDVEYLVEKAVEDRMNNLFLVHRAGKEIGAWEQFRVQDMLERTRAQLAEAAIEGNPLAADILNKSFKKIDPEANVDMGEWGRS